MIEILGLVAGSLTTISFLPQAVSILKTKHTKDISLPMYLTFTTGVLLWLIYGIFLHSLAVILANAITLVLASLILGLKIKYG